MPAHTVVLNNPPVGTLIFANNLYRVMLVYTTPNISNDMILVGGSLGRGIPLIADVSQPQVLLFNVIGTAMQGEVSVLANNSFGPTTVTEITRTPSGIT